MKTIILNTFDKKGGAARAAFRLHAGLRTLDVDSKMIVQFKSGDDQSVIGPPTKFAKGLAILRPTLDNLPLSFYREREPFIFSPAIMPDRIASSVSAFNPDIVHLHWLAAGFVRIESLKRFKKPLVWTLHDSWAFTGGCHLPFDCTSYQQSCGMCPILGSTKTNDLSHRVWRRKKQNWGNLDLTIVTPSQWMAERVRSSSLFQDTRIKVIPNGLEINKFKPMGKETSREILSLPSNKKLILFGSVGSVSDRNKGFHLLCESLKKIKVKGGADEADLVIFGASEPLDAPDCGLKVHYMGYLQDDVSMSLLYSAADLFVMSSLQETLPNTIMESFSCGTPVVAFNVGGIPEMVEHQLNGYLAQPYEIEDLAYGIEWVLEDEKRWQALSLHARQKVENEFDIRLVAQRYLDMYNEVLDK